MIVVHAIDITLFGGFVWGVFYAPYKALRWAYKKLTSTR